jgi:hypothetical protein
LLSEAVNPEIDCINEEEINNQLIELGQNDIIIPKKVIFEFNKKLSGKKIVE